MAILVKLLGIVIMAFGVIYLISPDVTKKYMTFWTKGKRIYAGGSLSFLIGIILLLAASQCRVAWYVALIGIVSLIKGIALVALGPEKCSAKIDWWTAKPPAVLRLLGLFALALGALLIYSS